MEDLDLLSFAEWGIGCLSDEFQNLDVYSNAAAVGVPYTVIEAAHATHAARGLFTLCTNLNLFPDIDMTALLESASHAADELDTHIRNMEAHLNKGDKVPPYEAIEKAYNDEMRARDSPGAKNSKRQDSVSQRVLAGGDVLQKTNGTAMGFVSALPLSTTGYMMTWVAVAIGPALQRCTRDSRLKDYKPRELPSIREILHTTNSSNLCNKFFYFLKWMCSYYLHMSFERPFESLTIPAVALTMFSLYRSTSGVRTEGFFVSSMQAALGTCANIPSTVFKEGIITGLDGPQAMKLYDEFLNQIDSDLRNMLQKKDEGVRNNSSWYPRLSILYEIGEAAFVTTNMDNYTNFRGAVMTELDEDVHSPYKDTRKSSFRNELMSKERHARNNELLAIEMGKRFLEGRSPIANTSLSISNSRQNLLKERAPKGAVDIQMFEAAILATIIELKGRTSSELNTHQIATKVRNTLWNYTGVQENECISAALRKAHQPGDDLPPDADALGDLPTYNWTNDVILLAVFFTTIFGAFNLRRHQDVYRMKQLVNYYKLDTAEPTGSFPTDTTLKNECYMLMQVAARSAYYALFAIQSRTGARRAKTRLGGANEYIPAGVSQQLFEQIRVSFKKDADEIYSLMGRIQGAVHDLQWHINANHDLKDDEVQKELEAASVSMAHLRDVKNEIYDTLAYNMERAYEADADGNKPGRPLLDALRNGTTGLGDAGIREQMPEVTGRPAFRFTLPLEDGTAYMKVLFGNASYGEGTFQQDLAKSGYAEKRQTEARRARSPARTAVGAVLVSSVDPSRSALRFGAPPRPSSVQPTRVATRVATQIRALPRPPSVVDEVFARRDRL